MRLKTHALKPGFTGIRHLTLAISSIVLLTAGCATQQPVGPPAAPPRAAVHAKPPDWYHQQLAAARAAKQAHQPASDTAGAQKAYNDVMRSACLHAAAVEPNQYTARCDTILHQQTPTQTLIDPCAANADDPAMQTDCSD